MVRPRNRLLVLALLLAATVAAGALIDAEPLSPAARAPAATPVNVPTPSDKRSPDPAEISLERSTAARLDSNGTEPFRATTWFVPPPPPKLDNLPPPKPVAPPLPFSYLGKLEDAPGKVIYYLVAMEKVYPVRAGEVVDNIYRIEGREGDSLVITYIPLSERQTLAIGGGQ